MSDALMTWQTACKKPPMAKPESVTMTDGFTLKMTRVRKRKNLKGSFSMSMLSESSMPLAPSPHTRMPRSFNWACSASKTRESSPSSAPCSLTELCTSGGFSEKYPKWTSYLGRSENQAAMRFRCTMCPAHGNDTNSNRFFGSGNPSGFNQAGAMPSLSARHCAMPPGPGGGLITPSNGVRRSTDSGSWSRTKSNEKSRRAYNSLPSTAKGAKSLLPHHVWKSASSEATLMVMVGDVALPSCTSTLLS
mmetsp:Transcript_126226/g.363055  ORF Transcript_126226/g.363055 Transcript_126226/m.363055 type:complete len:248 (-) Transcript_126226:2044-2787(-)